jgi:hypothetical protein
MRELHYGSDVVIVSFDVCNAIFDYAVALANAGQTDRITVPVLEAGERGFSNLLLGPATQLHCTAGPDRGQTIDLEDIDLVANLMAKTQRLTAVPTIVAGVATPAAYEDYDLS